MIYDKKWAIVVPMANEERDFDPFIRAVSPVINQWKPGRVYLIVDSVSQDRTLQLCQNLSAGDPRYATVWAPENRNVVDAYQKGLRVAFEEGHEFIIEMDAGLSHDPAAIPLFLEALTGGYECAFGSRFIRGGSMSRSPLGRRLLSRGGTWLAQLLLGAGLKDMTSGFQGFHRDVVARIIAYPFRSRAHFYQTEIRYLLRNRKIYEVPIHYQAPSPRVSSKAILNSCRTLWYYFVQRICGRAPAL